MTTRVLEPIVLLENSFMGTGSCVPAILPPYHYRGLLTPWPLLQISFAYLEVQAIFDP